MAAAVIGIRLRSQAHLLAREPWRAVILGLGLVWLLLMLPSLVWGRTALALQPGDIRADALVAVFTLVAVGWVVVPIATSGLDDTLDPARFRSLGVAAGRLMPGLAAGALLTIPAIATSVALAGLATSWAADGVGALAVALAGAVLTVACLVVGARVAAAWTADALSSSRSRLTTLVLAAVGVAALVPAAWQLHAQGLEAFIEVDADTLIHQLGLTPLGAGAAAPLALVAGDPLGVVWRLGMQAAWLALLLGAWRAIVDRALVAPPSIGTGTRRTRDEVLDPRPSLFAPRESAARAVRTRLRRAWRTDPRYLAMLAGAFILPALLGLVAVPGLGLDERWLYVCPLALAASSGWGRHNDVAYDSTAVWMDVTAGSLGPAVMRGRMSAALAWAAPSVAVVALAMLAVTGRWADAPGLLGACAGVMGLTLGISAVASVLVPYRVPAPGQSPFGAEVGSVGAGLLAQLASSAATLALVPLVLAPFILSLVVAPWWGAVALALGVVVGVGGYLGGVRLGGAAYDARAGALLAAVA
ncbi:hypothetical protein [Demequina pelophila]|uniref:hypothetical protein n=1 Tax=Demequina pelophila TaxID=1638984 RepID=UPI0007814D3C|nr:hypothetical protein [Demequina pelophila]